MHDQNQMSILQEIEAINNRVGNDIGNSIKRTMQREAIEKEFQYMNSKFMVSVPDHKSLLPLIKGNDPFKDEQRYKPEKIGMSDFQLKLANPMLPEIGKL